MTLLHADIEQRLEAFGDDTCELIQTIEKSFGIEFSGAELASSKSIRDLSARISAKLDHRLTTGCLSAIVFYRLRHAFTTLFDVPRSRIRSGTSLSYLMP